MNYLSKPKKSIKQKCVKLHTCTSILYYNINEHNLGNHSIPIFHVVSEEIGSGLFSNLFNIWWLQRIRAGTKSQEFCQFRSLSIFLHCSLIEKLYSNKFGMKSSEEVRKEEEIVNFISPSTMICLCFQSLSIHFW